jgi:hypothetical protein
MLSLHSRWGAKEPVGAVLFSVLFLLEVLEFDVQGFKLLIHRVQFFNVLLNLRTSMMKLVKLLALRESQPRP